MMHRLRKMREEAGLTQEELASRAGVSRQLVGAVETGRHLPRVDAALALASVLGVEVGALFSDSLPPVDVLTGSTPTCGSLVRVGAVGSQVVTCPARIGYDGWDVADGVMTEGRLTVFDRSRPGLVVVGCEPGLEVLERLLREAGMGAVAAAGTSATAVATLAAGRAHAAVVHGPSLVAPSGVDRFQLARWQVGLASPPKAAPGWWKGALSGRGAVIQREQGAQVQNAFERVAGSEVPGPRVGSHLVAARRAVVSGMPAVTIEPAAAAVSASFHPLETHEVQLWIDGRWMGERVVTDALEMISGQRFQRRLQAVGGYDLRGSGLRAP